LVVALVDVTSVDGGCGGNEEESIILIARREVVLSEMPKRRSVSAICVVRWVLVCWFLICLGALQCISMRQKNFRVLLPL